ncbi:hypothetical protein [Thalassococcus lentus]|uniref:von Hippel-Lindau disease tumour suppressor beta domain-containing protein n=1 Tax=Thalassococcus lentus TaxID=1210524 RepID=A0ABT4XRD7_9RHOB|nr:hypothetical protein [Thalassococcus lentus]MDA7424515.1 hypothetical protein [Thalassococcus lentus]
MRFPSLVTAGLIMASPMFAQNTGQSDMSWTYTRSVQQDVFDTFLMLSYGIPETDAVQFRAECLIGNSGPYVMMTLFSDVSGQTDGAPAGVTFTSNNGERFQRDGSVVGALAEVGISGVDVALFTNDPIWSIFSEGGPVYYDLPGQNALVLPMDGIADQAVRMIDDCARIDSLWEAGEQTGSDPDEPEMDPVCLVARNLRSIDGEIALSLTIRNDSGEYRGLYWIDHNGMGQSFGALDAGQSMTLDTREGHVWEFTDGPGNCVEVAVADRSQPIIALTKPAPYFGPE